MTGYDFCKFFDFTLTKEHGTADEDFYEGEYNYRAIDDQGCLHDRLVDNIADLTDVFDALLPDYVDEDLTYNGFKPNREKAYYEEALDWMDETGKLKSSNTYKVVSSLVHPETLTA